MSSLSPTSTTQFQGNDKILLGLVFSVITFWLFAQSTGIMAPLMLADLNGVPLGTSPEQLNVITPTQMNFAVSVTALFSGMFIVLAGGFADRYGRLKVAFIGNVLSIVGSLLIILASGGAAVPLIMLGRVIQGLSAACVMPSTLALVRSYWDGPARQRAVSMWSIGTFGGSGLASFVSGNLATWLGWRSVFVVSIVVSILAIVLLRGAPEVKVSPDQVRKPDPIGIAIFLVTVLALMIIATFGAGLGWGSPIILGCIAVFVVGLIVFWIWEHKVDVPFIDFALFSNRMFTGATLANFMVNSGIGLVMVSQQLLIIGGRMTAQAAGLVTLGYAIAVIVFIRLGEKVMQKKGPRFPMVLAVISLGLGTIMFLPTNLLLEQYLIFAAIGYLLFGLGLALFATPATDTALTNLPAEQAAAGAGIFKMASSLGAALGAAISLTLFTTFSGGGAQWVGEVLVPMGRTDNVGVRQAADVSFLFHLALFVLSLIIILVLIPSPDKRAAQEPPQAKGSAPVSDATPEPGAAPSSAEAAAAAAAPAQRDSKLDIEADTGHRGNTPGRGRP